MGQVDGDQVPCAGERRGKEQGTGDPPWAPSSQRIPRSLRFLNLNVAFQVKAGESNIPNLTDR